MVEEADVFEYKDIPGFPVSTGESLDNHRPGVEDNSGKNQYHDHH